ncbi:ribonuclease pancreatic gamma-type-like [Megalops cyprinoides]|uniref:ribonuclease pancreatic gamma-type-like n=1 Tax=Megalops cyprinoides TaxID=118141 RepID=UPI0018648F28|nr:ribonuclease pancreatic gamma-type-like [Megalops cyprinoides]XP_036403476.1 ribonuclease pancreatic gamma-type-like [Megalops cyprinoides]
MTMIRMMVMRAALGLSCLFLAHCSSPPVGSEFTGPPSAPRPCVLLQASTPDLHPDLGVLPPGGVSEGSSGWLWRSAGAQGSLTVAQGCVVTLWGEQGGHQSFPSGTHVPLKGLKWPLALHCSCEEEEGQPRRNESAYQKFLRQHLDQKQPRGNDKYCNKMMSSRITNVTKMCKKVNTFIHATKQKVKNVCDTKPIKKTNNHKSMEKFALTKCTLQGGRDRPPCRYRASNSNDFITIACRNNEPVHLDGQGDEN